MGEVAHTFQRISAVRFLNTSGHFGGSPEISARNHRSILRRKNIIKIG